MENEKFSGVWVNGELPDPGSVVVLDIVEDLWATYTEEVGSLLTALEAAAMSLESGQNVTEDAAEIRRVLHSIKGDSGMAGVMDVQRLCHETESALDELIKKGQATDVLLKVKDWIEGAMEHISKANISAEKTREMEQAKIKDKRRALVLDDDIVCRERLKMLLGDFFDCTFACNGKEGLLIYERSLDEENPFRLVTLDINMPEMDGHETLQGMRRSEQERGVSGLDGVKVIITTSEDGSDHMFAAFNQGCEAYVVKAKMGQKLLDEIAKLGLLKVVKVQTDYAIE